MNQDVLLKKAEDYLSYFCIEISERRVGSQGNRMATDFVNQKFKEFGWLTNVTELSVIDWKTEGATLNCDGIFFDVFSSPYSLGCNVKAQLVGIDTIEKLIESDITGRIVFLYGKIASEQIMPKNFVFYNPEEHQQIIALLECKKPNAIICATQRNGAVAGGVYPFPMFEDGDFNIPSVYMKDVEGEKLIQYNNKIVELKSSASRIPETAYNIIANKSLDRSKRIVVSAHVDAKIGTPGAIDNATGVTILLLLAHLLQNYSGNYSIELVPFNGEDYYSIPGQMKYIEQNFNGFDDIILNINIDGAGYHIGPSSFSEFNLPEEIRDNLNRIIQYNSNIVNGIPWVQGDHSIFIHHGCPAIAVSSDWFIKNIENQDITHTPKDNISIVNYQRVVECALAIRDLINSIE